MGLLPAIPGYLRRLELPQRLRGLTIPSAPDAHFKPPDRLMTPVTLFITGIARISPIDRTPAGETALARMPGLGRLPSGDTLDNLLGTVTARHVKQVGRIHREDLDEQARLDPGAVIADRDLPVRSTRGRKRPGATPGHDPNPEGRDCYRWAVAFAAGVVVWQPSCRGNTSGHSLVRPALEALRPRMPHLAVLRLGGGSLSAKVLDLLASRRVDSLTRAGTKLVPVRTPIERARPQRWPSYDGDTRLGRWDRVQSLDDFGTPVTAALVECRRRIKKMRKGRLPWKARVFHHAIVTDQHHGSTAKIYQTYKARWAVENSFKESNRSFSSGKLPSGQFRGDEPFLG